MIAAVFRTISAASLTNFNKVNMHIVVGRFECNHRASAIHIYTYHQPEGVSVL